MINWQPIDTAPRDGTWILLCGGETSEDDYLSVGVPISRPVVGRFIWDEDFNGIYPDKFYDTWDICYWDGEWRTQYENPTHWMPLPPPPKGE